MFLFFYLILIFLRRSKQGLDKVFSTAWRIATVTIFSSSYKLDINYNNHNQIIKCMNTGKQRRHIMSP
jgi:hypothetical protein